MKENRKQELKKMLDEAMRTVCIVHRKYPVSISQFQDAHLSEVHSLYANYLRSSAHADIGDVSTKSQIIEFLKAELSMYFHGDKIGCGIAQITSGLMSYNVEDILQSILRVSIVWGVDRATNNLEKAIQQNRIPYKYMAVIGGISVGNEMEISDGVRFIPLPKSSRDLPDYLPLGFESTFRDFMGRTIISIDYSVPNAFYKPTKGFNLFSQTHHRSEGKEIKNFQPQDFYPMLSLACNCAVHAMTRWDYVGKDEICNLSPVTGGISYLRYDHSATPVFITKDQIKAAKALYEKFTCLDAEVRDMLEVAILRWRESKTAKSLVDKMIDLGIAYESLYLRGGNREQLSYTLRLRAAWYLGEDAEDRKYLIKLLQKMYEYRSAAVHQGKLDEKSKIVVLAETFSTQELIEKSQDLCLQSIRKIIEDGTFPDWDSLVVGEKIS